MTTKLPLASRAFLFAFLPICLTLGASFFTINQTIRAEIKQGLKESLRRMERTLNATAAEYNNRNLQMLTILTEGAGLSTGIDLLREVPSGQAPQPKVIKHIE